MGILIRIMKGKNEWKKWNGKWMKNMKGKNELENEGKMKGQIAGKN